MVVKYFATWGDIKDNFASWDTIANMEDWQTIRTYIPPQYEV